MSAVAWGMPDPVSDSIEYPLNTKIQALLLHNLEEGRIVARMKQTVTDFAKLGSQFAKVQYKEKTVPKWEHVLNEESGEWETIRGKDLVYEAIVVIPIDLAQLIPDPQAQNDDVQNEWRWIGHRIEKTYDEILEGFRSGYYNLNEEEFKKRFDSKAEEGITLDNKVHEDEDKDMEPDPQGRVQLWEIHGEVPSESQGPTECMTVIATDRACENPESGLQIKLTTHPVCFSCGLRPFLGCHFIPQTEPFGMGLIDRQEETIYDLSQAIAQFQDGMRLTCNPTYSCPFDSPAWEQIQQDGGMMVPGRIYGFHDPNQKIEPNRLADFNPQVLMEYINTKKAWLEQQTLTEIFQGFGAKDQTATAAHIQQQQAAKPTQTITMIFARNFLNPLGKIALGWIQQMVLADREIRLPGPNGQDVTTTITAEEIQTGRFKVVATLVRTDATKLAKAQSFERMIPVLINAMPQLQQEGSKVVLAETIRRWIDQIGVDGADRIVQTIGTREQMLMQQVQQLQMQLDQMSQVMAQLQHQKVGDQSQSPTLPQNNGPAQFPEQGPMGPEPTDQNVMADVFKEIQRQAHQPMGENLT